MKLCVSLTEDTTAALVARMAELAELADLFEVRADFVRDLDLAAVLRARVKPLLFTCRPESEGGRCPDRDQERRRRMLSEAVELGFDLVDVNARGAFDDVVASKAGRGLVLSWHDLEGTPDDLDSIYDRMAALGPDIVKIAVTARSIADLGRLLAFAARHAGDAAPRLVALAMGPLGVASRILGGRFGAPFTFASAAAGQEAAPGQIPARTLVDCYRVRQIGRDTRVFGLVGSDVLRSLSPAIQNRALRGARGGRGLRAAAGGVAARPRRRAPGARRLGLQRDAALQARDRELPRLRDAARGRGGIGEHGAGAGRASRRPEHRRRRCPRAAAAADRPVGRSGGDPRRRRGGARGRLRARPRGSARDGGRAAGASRPTRSRPRPVAPPPGSTSSRRLPYDVLVNATPVGSGAIPGESPVAAGPAATGQRRLRHGLRAARDAAARRRARARAASRSTASRCWWRRRWGSSRPGRARRRRSRR